MSSLDGFSMYPLARKLHSELAGGRIDRVLQPNKHTILLSIRQPGKNLTLHISINPQSPAMHLISHSIENPPVPPIFCMVLRKQIEDGRIASVTQFGLDRMISLHIDVLGPGGIILTKTLTVEMMGKHSNMILLQDKRIIDAIRKVGSNENRLRQILPGKEYVLPPNQDKINLITDSVEKWRDAIRACEGMPIAKAIVRASLGMGPVSAREFVWRAGLPADLCIEDMDNADFDALTATVCEVVEEFKNGVISPVAAADANGKLLAISAFRLAHLSAHTMHEFASISEMLDFAAAVAGSYTPPDRERFKKLVGNEINKAKNKFNVLQEELSQAHNAEEYKVKADILMTYQYQLNDGYVKQVVLPNIYSAVPEEETVTIELDPLLSPMQNMQKYYQKYNKLKRAQESLAVQLLHCQNDIRYLSSIDSSLDSSSTQTEINEIKAELSAAGYLAENKKRKMHEKPSQPLKFNCDGMVILVGKNNYQNDQLTFKTSQLSDLWLHVKDIPGSHVILRCEGQPPPQETIQFAAELAGYFSKAKDSSNIPVDCTLRRYVKKPSGAKPGFVIYTNQTTLYITPDHQKIEPLLPHAAK